jgi:hypothetical protein
MTLRGSCCLWRAPSEGRYFIVPANLTLVAGDFVVVDQAGATRSVALEALRPYEVTEPQARRWAKDELGRALEELRRGADEKLAELRARLEAFNREPIGPDAKATRDLGPALLGLLKDLPGVLAKSLSGDAERVGDARETMARLQQRLREAGVDLDARFSGFPDRLAKLREEFERERAKAKPEDDAAKREK